MKNRFISRTSLNRYSGITSGFDAFFYAIVTENVAEIQIVDERGLNRVSEGKNYV